MIERQKEIIMGNTTTYGWPYPELTDPPDGASQMKALANAIDATVGAGMRWIRFTQNLTTVLPTSAVDYAGYAKVNASAGGDVFQLHAANSKVIDCLVAGYYQITITQIIDFSASRTTGYVNLLLESPVGTIVQAAAAPQGGSLMTFLILPTFRRFAAGESLAIKIGNQSGGNASLNTGNSLIDLVRIGP